MQVLICTAIADPLASSVAAGSIIRAGSAGGTVIKNAVDNFTSQGVGIYNCPASNLLWVDSASLSPFYIDTEQALFYSGVIASAWGLAYLFKVAKKTIGI
jgi:hypothetical protein